MPYLERPQQPQDGNEGDGEKSGPILERPQRSLPSPRVVCARAWASEADVISGSEMRAFSLSSWGPSGKETEKERGVVGTSSGDAGGGNIARSGRTGPRVQCLGVSPKRRRESRVRSGETMRSFRVRCLFAQTPTKKVGHSIERCPSLAVARDGSGILLRGGGVVQSSLLPVRCWSPLEKTASGPLELRARRGERWTTLEKTASGPLELLACWTPLEKTASEPLVWRTLLAKSPQRQRGRGCVKQCHACQFPR